MWCRVDRNHRRYFPILPMFLCIAHSHRYLNVCTIKSKMNTKINRWCELTGIEYTFIDLKSWAASEWLNRETKMKISIASRNARPMDFWLLLLNGNISSCSCCIFHVCFQFHLIWQWNKMSFLFSMKFQTQIKNHTFKSKCMVFREQNK